ncbi:MAG: SDR family NAD(P)-dependent oxidoreductase [Hyphomicrobiales bacterium]|jgi:NAD(P)-dependent dehydrogenase (short-subunit alcohol dehydrogenase family)
MNSIDLKGRVAVITGGAQGIGLAVAQRMATSGAQTIIWDVDEALGQKAAKDLGGTFALLDQSDEAQVTEATQQAEASHGSIDVLVASAGIAGSNGPVWEYPTDEWRRIININLNGLFYLNRAIVPGMIERGYGRIVNIASIAGKEGNPNASAYSASKAAVIALTKSLGKETAAHNIAVNCVTPAAARTRIFDQMSQEHIDYMLSKIPRGRFLEVDEAAAMIAWLASEDNSFTTGSAFDLSGGRATY